MRFFTYYVSVVFPISYLKCMGLSTRLNLPGEIQENDASTGDYDCDKGDFTLKFSKVCKGEYFDNLDMITTLLAPSKKKHNLVPTIEVISKYDHYDFVTFTYFSKLIISIHLTL